MDQADSLRRMVQLRDQEVLVEPAPGKTQRTAPKIFAVTSGKGGVGKTNLTLNLAIQLSKQEHKKVLVLDADFGTANVDIMLGVFPKYNISHVIFDDMAIEDVLIDGPYQVKVLPGVSGVAQLSSLTEHQKAAFFEKLEMYQLKYEPDYLLIDTGAGVGNNVINFLLAADEVIVILTAEPTSLADAYAIIKTLHQYEEDKKVNVVVNMVKEEQSAKKVFNILQSVCHRFLNKDLNYLGFIRYYKSVSAAVQAQKPIVISYPNSDVSLEILQLSNKILHRPVDPKRSMKDFFTVATKYLRWNND